MKKAKQKRNNSLHATRYTLHAVRGFALIFAILASSLLLSIAVAIFNLSFRQVILSSFGRESQIAFFASDAGTECALYWDLVASSFATSADSLPPPPLLRPPSPTCAQNPAGPVLFPAGINCNTGLIIAPKVVACNNRSAVTTFSMTGAVCADVIVTKTDDDGDTISDTKVESFGHNTCDPANPTYVERALRITY